jgi:hypothetical protein
LGSPFPEEKISFPGIPGCTFPPRSSKSNKVVIVYNGKQNDRTKTIDKSKAKKNNATKSNNITIHSINIIHNE